MVVGACGFLHHGRLEIKNRGKEENGGEGERERLRDLFFKGRSSVS